MMMRDTKTDIAKGIGILLIVFGHNWITLHEPSRLLNIIYSFHVPLFYFLSGIFVRESDSLRNFLTVKAESILKPYVVSCIIFWILLNLKYYPQSFIGYAFGVFYGVARTLPYAPLWFLPNLFFSMAVMKIILAATRGRKASNEIRFAFAAALLLIGITCIGTFWSTDISNRFLLTSASVPVGLPYSVDVAPITVAFLLFGYLLRDNVASYKFRWPHLILTAVAFAVLHFLFSYTIDLNTRRYDSYVVSTTEAALGIFLVICASAWVAKNRTCAYAFSYVGSASLIILIFHSFCQNQAFFQASKILHEGYASGAVAFAIGVGVPLAIYFVLSKFRLLWLLFFPAKRVRAHA